MTGLSSNWAYADGTLTEIPKPEPSADEKKAMAWAGIMAKRDRLMASGGYEVGEKWYHSDGPSRVQQLGLVLLGANIPEGLMWKTMDGSFVAMTPTLAGQILTTAAASDFAIFTAAEVHRAAMATAEDPALYDYSGGWPDVFSISSP
jgi:hypothetical protein